MSATARYVAFQMAKVAIRRQMFREILQPIAQLRPKPPPAPASAADSYAFKSTRQEECAQMLGKMVDAAVRGT